MYTQLVRVPYNTNYLGTPQAVELLLKACQIAGHNIPLTDGWRPYQIQKGLWDGWVARKPGYNLASNPDDPNAQNNHLRGEAWDIQNRADRAAMLAAGFTPDGVEWWHFNEPNWRSMPIIKDTSGLANVTSKEIEDEDMAGAMVGLDDHGTLWLLPDNGEKTSLSTMSQLDALLMTGAIRKVRPEQAAIRDQYYIKLSQDVIDRRTEIAVRRKGQNK